MFTVEKKNSIGAPALYFKINPEYCLQTVILVPTKSTPLGSYF